MVTARTNCWSLFTLPHRVRFRVTLSGPAAAIFKELPNSVLVTTFTITLAGVAGPGAWAQPSTGAVRGPWSSRTPRGRVKPRLLDLKGRGLTGGDSSLTSCSPVHVSFRGAGTCCPHLPRDRLGAAVSEQPPPSPPLEGMWIPPWRRGPDLEETLRSGQFAPEWGIVPETRVTTETLLAGNTLYFKSSIMLVTLSSWKILSFIIYTLITGFFP